MAASDIPIRILVDSRETRSPVLEALRRTPRAQIEVAELEVGDYVIAEGAAIERKSANDLVLSILDGRFVGQTEMMKSAYVRSYLLIEGDPYSVRSEIAPAAITGALSHAAVNCNMTVIASPDARQSAELIFTMAMCKVKGIGTKTAERIVEVLRANVLDLHP